MGEVPRDDSVASIRTEMQETMEEAAGIYRTGEALAKGADLLRELQEQAAQVGVRDTSRSWNTELVGALEAANMLDIAECMLRPRCSARSRAAPTSARTSPPATTSGSSSTSSRTATPTARPGWRSCR